ncbi:MAG: tetratricopeptide repeat protein [Candidatus Edwardsbacteria bacterium]
MSKCPFSSQRQILSEIKYDAEGKIIEQKETPSFQLLECLKEECELYDVLASECSLPLVAECIRGFDSLQTKSEQAFSTLSELKGSLEKFIQTSSTEKIRLPEELTNNLEVLLAEMKKVNETLTQVMEKEKEDEWKEEIKSLYQDSVKIFSGIGEKLESLIFEIKESKETTAASLLHLLKKSDALSEVIKKSSEENIENLTSQREILVEIARGQKDINESLKTTQEESKQSSLELTKILSETALQSKENITLLSEIRTHGDSQIDVLEKGLEQQTKDSNELLSILKTNQSQVGELFAKLSSENKENFIIQKEILKEIVQKNEALLEALQTNALENSQALKANQETYQEFMKREQLPLLLEMTRKSEALITTIENKFQENKSLWENLIGKQSETKEALVNSFSNLLRENEKNYQQFDKNFQEEHKLWQELLSETKTNGEGIISSLTDVSKKSDVFSALLTKEMEENVRLNDRLLEEIKLQTTEQKSTREEIKKANQEMLEVLAKNLDDTSTAIKSLVLLEKDRNDRLEKITAEILTANKQTLTFLEEEKKRKEEEEKIRVEQSAVEHNEKGIALYFKREFEAAVVEFEKALELNPNLLETYNNLGLALSESGKEKEAVASFKRAIEINPDFAEAYNNLGALHKGKGRYEEAVELFNQAISKRSNYALAYLNLGNAYEELEKFDQALKAWEKSLEIDPTLQEAKKKLGVYKR